MWKSIALGLVTVCSLQCLVCGQDPPEVSGSFRAVGEIVENFPDSGGLIMQFMFEENYDVESSNAAYTVWELGKNITFIEYHQTGQTFQYVEGKECFEYTIEDWIETDAPPSLMKYEDTNGKVRFSVRQLFKLDTKYIKERNISTTLRGIPARKWMYEIKGVDNGTNVTVAVYAYWSDPNSGWNLTSNKDSVPLGFAIDKIVLDEQNRDMKVHEQFINLHSFLFDTVDKKVFEPRQGIICPNRNETIKFPNITNYEAVSFHSEVIFPNYQEIKTLDSWYDTTNKMLRIDLDRIKDEVHDTQKDGRKYVSEIISGNLGVIFRLTWYKGKAECTIDAIGDYETDIQDIIDPKLGLEDWNIRNVFGLKDTKYVYLGKTAKRNVPCHVFQGTRNDWPQASAGVSSLWEWCIALHLPDDDEEIIFRDNELPIVNAEVTILESKNTDYPKGFKLIHHFYDVKVEDPNIIDAVNFDVRYCFGQTERKYLQFEVTVKITEDNKYVIENATSDVSFLQMWKAAITKASGLDLSSLRISKVESTVVDFKLFVRFILLGVHGKLPDKAKKGQKSLDEAEKTLKAAVDGNELQIKYKPERSTDFLTLTAVKDSLVEQIKVTDINLPTGSPPTSPATTPKKPTGFTIITDPENLHTTPGPRTVFIGHQPSSVAAATIIMLLIGITIGSAGTFVKFNGLPACMKRGG